MRSIDAVALWFDVEKRYNATGRPELSSTIGLWFDVEKRYNTTSRRTCIWPHRLWFDMETVLTLIFL